MLGTIFLNPQAIPLALLLVFISIVWFKLYLERRKSNPAGLPTPPGPKGISILGSLFQMNGYQEWLTYYNWAKKYGEFHLYLHAMIRPIKYYLGDLVFVNVAGTKLLFLNSPKVVNDLLDKQAEIYSDRPDIPMLELYDLPC
jgi:hypothetical protein